MEPSKRAYFKSRIKDPNLLRMLDEPVDSTVTLTREQAIELVHAGIGAPSDLPPGNEFVRKTAKIWRGLLPRD